MKLGKFRLPYLGLLITPFLMYGFGAALNTLAVSANHGMMPVTLQTTYKMLLIDHGWVGPVIDQVHKAMEPGDHLKILCDWIQFPRMGTFSIGDLFLEASDAIRNYVIGAWLALVAVENQK